MNDTCTGVYCHSSG
ncbi:CxxxxCH/CxxCH domain-containing protein [uncultured Bacteroides sp.]